MGPVPSEFAELQGFQSMVLWVASWLPSGADSTCNSLLISPGGLWTDYLGSKDELHFRVVSRCPM